MIDIKRSIVASFIFFAALTSNAIADFSATIPNVKTLPPLPACAGPIWCSVANDYIRTYNSYANTLNQINHIGLEVQSYARYPQIVQTQFTGNMNSIANLLQQSQGVNAQVKNIELQVSQLWPNYHPGTSLSSLNQQLNQSTASSIVTSLKGAGLLSQTSTDSSMSSTIAAIRAAAANAVSPTQATQIEVQMLTLLWEQMVKEQRLTELRMAEEAQYDLRNVARDQQQIQFDQSLVQSLQTSIDGTPPSFSQAQMQAIMSPATHSGQ